MNSVSEGVADVMVNGKSYKVELEPRAGMPICAPMPGRVVTVCVSVGEQVKKGQTVVVVETMKMENEILSEYEGRVSEICVRPGDAVAAETELIVIE